MKPQFLLLLLCCTITAIQAQVETPPTTEELQVFWVLGVSYNLSKGF
ncbi:MAG: hypothetical protein H6573_15320 [Lewinellaceae bacterium]|nr:hypothetical protein [Phaeodactylibacter sp.]MCB9348858.1 hypothetical protein [Lewinellaceae bacterium]